LDLGADEETTIFGESLAINPIVRRLNHGELVSKLAWMQGRVWFEPEKLSDAISEFNRYNRLRLVIEGPVSGKLRIGGQFGATDPETFAIAVAETLHIQVVHLRDATSGSPQIVLTVKAHHDVDLLHRWPACEP